MINDGLSESVAKQFSASLEVSDDVFRSIRNAKDELIILPIAPTERLRIGSDEIVGENFLIN